MRDALDTPRTYRFIIAGLLTGRTVRTTDLVAAIAACLTAGSLTAIDTATFGLLSGTAADDSCSITATDTTVTSPNNPWTAADVGKVFHLAGAGVAGGTLVTTIASYTGPGEIELAHAASTTVAATKTSAGGLAAWGNLLNVTIASPVHANQAGTEEYQARSADDVLASGTTTERSLEARFAEVVNVLDFGAVAGDGNSDSAAFQAAVTRAAAIGARVIVPPGSYTAGGLTATAAVTIELADGASIACGGANFITSSASVRLSGGSFSGFDCVVKLVGIGASTDLEVRSVRASVGNSLVNVRYDDNPAGNLRMALVENCRAASLESWAVDISPAAFTDVRVAGNNFIGCKVRAIGIGNNSSGEGYTPTNQRVHVTDNDISGVTQSGVIEEIQGIYITGCRYAVVTGNVLQDGGRTSSGILWEGIYVKAGGSLIANNQIHDAGGNQGAIVSKGSGVGTEQDNHHIIRGNLIRNTVATTVPTCPIYVQTSSCVIQGNTFVGNFTRSIQVNQSVETRRLVIDGNCWLNVVADILIEIKPRIRTFAITNNTVINLRGINAAPDFVRISGNTTSTGGTIESGAITGNVIQAITDNVGADGGLGVRVDLTGDLGATFTQLAVIGNVFGKASYGLRGFVGTLSKFTFLANDTSQVLTAPHTTGTMTVTSRYRRAIPLDDVAAG